MDTNDGPIVIQHGVPTSGERSDAARNRQRILDAADAVFRSAHDPRSVTMEDIARSAGVGRATLYRRYATVGEVATALLDTHERQIQERILHGPPPLGPGAPPAERLEAFYVAMLELLETHAPLALGAEAGTARYQTGAYGFWQAHMKVLLDAADHPANDSLADVLLAPLAPELYTAQRQSGTTKDEILAAVTELSRLLA